MLPLDSKLVQLVGGECLHRGFLPSLVDSYTSPSFIKSDNLSNCSVSDQPELFQLSLTKLQENDSSLLSLSIDCQTVRELESAHFDQVLALNSTLLELNIRYQQFTETMTPPLVEALKVNSTLTRLSLRSSYLDDAASTHLSELIRFNTTLLSLDLSNTRITEIGLGIICAALSLIQPSFTLTFIRMRLLMLESTTFANF